VKEQTQQHVTTTTAGGGELKQDAKSKLTHVTKVGPN